MDIDMKQANTATIRTPHLKRAARIKEGKPLCSRFTRSRAGNIFILIFLIAAGLFCVLPLIYSIITSFKPLDELLIFPPQFYVKRPTLENYTALPELMSSLSVPISRYIFNSLFVGAVTTALYILLSSMAAFVLSKSDLKGRNVIALVVQFALLFNTFTMAMPQYLILAKLRVIDTYLAYILPYLATTLGVFLMKQYMDGYVSDTFLEAAKIDGAGYFRIFWQIVMPMVKPAWFTLILFAFRDVWALIPQGTIISESLKTLPMITNQITTAGGIARSGSAMAVTTMLMIPPVIIYFLSQSHVVEALNSAGIKE